jgi:hypothetical protein
MATANGVTITATRVRRRIRENRSSLNATRSI